MIEIGNLKFKSQKKAREYFQDYISSHHVGTDTKKRYEPKDLPHLMALFERHHDFEKKFSQPLAYIDIERTTIDYKSIYHVWLVYKDGFEDRISWNSCIHSNGDRHLLNKYRRKIQKQINRFRASLN